MGIYTVAASYGSEDSEGFEAPYFYGESQVRVRDGETASTGVTAALANCRFAFSYTDAFTGYVADWSATYIRPEAIISPSAKTRHAPCMCVPAK